MPQAGYAHCAHAAGAGFHLLTRPVGPRVGGESMVRYDEATKAKALMLAETLTIREAAQQTGVPEGTIKRWRFENRTEPSEPNRTNRTPKNLGPVIEKAVEKAVAEAGDYIAARIKALADELYGLAEDGVRETRAFMRSPGVKDRDSAAWLRSVVGAMHYGIQDAQLLSGKPTARPEVMERHEYDITKRIIADPEAVELANSLLRRAANCDAGALRIHGERGPVDTV